MYEKGGKTANLKEDSAVSKKKGQEVEATKGWEGYRLLIFLKVLGGDKGCNLCEE